MSEDTNNGNDIVSVLAKSYERIEDVPENVRSHFKAAPLDPNRTDKTVYTFNGNVPVEHLTGLINTVKATRKERDEVLSELRNLNSRKEETPKQQSNENEDFLSKLKASYENDLRAREEKLLAANRTIEEFKQREVYNSISSRLRDEAQKSGVHPQLIDDFVRLNVDQFEITETGDVKLKMGYGTLSDWIYAKKESSPAYWGVSVGGGSMGGTSSGGGYVTISRSSTTAEQRIELRNKAQAEGKAIRMVD